MKKKILITLFFIFSCSNKNESPPPMFDESIKKIRIEELKINNDLSITITWTKSSDETFEKYEVYDIFGKDSNLIFVGEDINTTNYRSESKKKYSYAKFFIRHFADGNKYNDGPSDSTNVHLSPDVLEVPSSSFNTIQSAINVANSSDVVLVSRGEYQENIIFNGKKNNIKLLSKDGPENTIIDGGGKGNVITIVAWTNFDTSTVINGFTIQNAGYASNVTGGQGSGIHIGRADIIISNNIIKNNWNSDGGGGGIYTDNSSPIIINNIFENNRADFAKDGSYGGNFQGGAICVYFGKPIISNNIFIQNKAYHWGGALYIYAVDDITISNNVFYGNEHLRPEGEIWNGSILSGQYHDKSYNINLVNCIFLDSKKDLFTKRNSLGDELPISINISYGNYDSEDSDVNYEEGNISVEPLFEDLKNFKLSSNSPCIDKGHPDQSQNDVDGSRNDMGAYGGPLGDWNK